MTATLTERAPARSASRPLVKRETTPPAPAPGNSPWQRGDYVMLGGRLAVGVIGLLVSWIGCSGTTDWNQQQVWVAVAIGALVIGLAGVGSWLLSGIRAIKEDQISVLALVQERLGMDAVVEAAPEPAVAQAEIVVTSPGMTFFHRPRCVLVRGKTVHQVTRRESSSLEPCWVCQP